MVHFSVEMGKSVVLPTALCTVVALGLGYKAWTVSLDGGEENDGMPIASENLNSKWLPRRAMVVLNQICDAFIPAVTEEEFDQNGLFLIHRSFDRFLPNFRERNPEILEELWQKIQENSQVRSLLLSGARELGVARVLAEAMEKLLLKEQKFLVSTVLRALSTPIGNFLINGHFRGFHRLSLEERVNCLRGLRDSYIPQLRGLYQSFKRLTGSLFASFPFDERLDSYGLKGNPAWAVMGYVPGETMNKPITSSFSPSAAISPRIPLPDPEVADERTGGCKVYSADVVVVGSGSGGGTVAAELVKAGHRVIVLEKGPYHTAQQFKTLTEAEAFEASFERGGLVTTKDNNIVILAGAMVGGGSSVNWSASFRTPDYVRREWAQSMSCFRDGGAFEAALDKAHDLFGVNTDYTHKPGQRSAEDLEELSGCVNSIHRLSRGIDGGPNLGYHMSADVQDSAGPMEPSTLSSCKSKEVPQICVNLNNEILCRGAKKEGYHPEAIPRNVKGCVDCGHCCHGCPYGAKQSTVTSQMEPLAGSGRLFLIPHCYTDSVLLQKGSAVGVKATVTDKDTSEKEEIEVHAPVVVSCCGSLHTPALLLRSGLRNAHIGRHIALHPVVGCGGFFDPDTLGDIYSQGGYPRPPRELITTGLASGVSMGVVVRSKEEQKDHQSATRQRPSQPLYGAELKAETTRERTHGILQNQPAIETPPIHPGILGLVLPWDNGLAFKACMLWYNQMAAFIGIPRDMSSYYNRVTLNADGLPEIEYTITKEDEQRCVHGLEMQMRMMRSAGAKILFYLHENCEWIDDMSDEVFERAVDGLRKEGIVANRMQVFSAHQLSSCRMAASAKEGPVRPTGETYEVSGLYVADGSILPTSLGINPMITIEALAIMIAKEIDERIRM